MVDERRLTAVLGTSRLRLLRLGGQVPAFDADLRKALPAHTPDRIYDETVRTEAIIATRP